MGPHFVFVGTGPLMEGCPRVANETGFRHVMTTIDLKFEAGTWRGQPQSVAGGSFDLRFTTGPLGPGGPGGGPGIAGTVTGVVVSTIAIGPNGDLQGAVPDSRATFGGPLGSAASLAGGVSQGGFIASGVVSGDVAFSNSSGTSVSCNSGTVS